MKISVYTTPLETARGLILHIIQMLESNPYKKYHIAFSGGSTPSIMYKLWANEYKNLTPWERICIYWVDERCVPANNPESNFGIMRSILLNHVPVPAKQIFPIQGENIPDIEAERYSDLIISNVSNLNNLPIFDLVLLGAGNDGHTSSIFPGQEALLTDSHIYMPSVQPASQQKRIALTGQPIIHANQTIFLITGKEKADVVAKICETPQSGPAAYIAHHAKDAILFLDKMAGEKIKG